MTPKEVRRILGIRLCSGNGSVQRGEASWLAVIETAIAISIFMAIAVWFGTVNHIAFASSIAPLLLLKTSHSIRLGVAIIDWQAHEYEFHSRAAEELATRDSQYRRRMSFFKTVTPYFIGLLLTWWWLGWPEGQELNDFLTDFAPQIPWSVQQAILFVAVLIFTLISFCLWLAVMCSLIFLFYISLVRFGATTVSFFCHPLDSLSAITRNWYVACACVDRFCPAEVVPNYENAGKTAWLKASRFRAYYARALGHGDDDKVLHLLALNIFMPVGLCSLLFFSFLGRFSLKATSIIYLPFLWIAWTTTRKPKSIRQELQKLFKGELTLLAILYSAGVIVLFAVKLFWFALIGRIHEVGNELANTNLAKIVTVYFVPDYIPMWQLAAFANAVLAFTLFMLGKRAIAWNVSGKVILRTIRCTAFVRGILSLYTVSCMLYITFQSLPDLKLPPLDTKLFPWT